MNLLKHYIMIFFVSMVPIVELRGAIPISQGFGLPLLQSYIICVIGNTGNILFRKKGTYLGKR